MMIKYRDWSRLIQFLALLLTSCRRISGAHMGQQGSGWNKLAMSHHHLLEHNEVASCGEKWLGHQKLANLPCFNHWVLQVLYALLNACKWYTSRHLLLFPQLQHFGNIQVAMGQTPNGNPLSLDITAAEAASQITTCGLIPGRTAQGVTTWTLGNSRCFI